MKVRIDRSKLLKHALQEQPIVSYRITGKEPLVHGYMKYLCEKCGLEWLMPLEIGVEDHGKNGVPHQPCPFVMSCTCGGVARDVSGYIPLRDVVPLPPQLRYFAYDYSGKDMACGIASVYIPRKTEL